MHRVQRLRAAQLLLLLCLLSRAIELGQFIFLKALAVNLSPPTFEFADLFYGWNAGIMKPRFRPDGPDGVCANENSSRWRELRCPGLKTGVT